MHVLETMEEKCEILVQAVESKVGKALHKDAKHEDKPASPAKRAKKSS